jgi:DNA-binding transcriptional ArsR family regulator
VLIYNRMVVDELQSDELQGDEADRVFHALADATRRDILLRTLDARHNVSALARCYPMSFAAVQKHVAVLEGAGLVTKLRNGREQLVSGNVETMRRAHRLLEDLEAVWRARIDQIGEVLADDDHDADEHDDHADDHNGGTDP